jgi:tRNA(Ile2)-agmatinylcytidine synthase
MAIERIRIGLDDTDAPGGLCTTWLGAELARRLEAAGMRVREGRLVRLNPNAPFRTRGNAAVALHVEGDPALAFELACAAVEEFAPLEAPMTNPGVVVADRFLPVDCYLRAVTDLCTVGETLDALDAAGARFRGYGNGRGLIGAAAAVAAEFIDRTYELLAYRDPSRWGMSRDIDGASLFRAEAATFPHTWDSVDRESDTVVCVPHTPDPVLFGIRGESPAWVARARSFVVSEPPALEACWTTNQGTDAHLVAGSCGALREGRSYTVAGTVAERPVTGLGGHVTAWIADGGERLRCMAYEPTKGFRDTVRALRPGDRVVAHGSYRHGSLNLEKLAVLEVALQERTRPPRCPSCGRRTTSAGRERGWKCRACGARTREPEVTAEPRAIAPGWYEVPPVARRHLARPLCRGAPPPVAVEGSGEDERDVVALFRREGIESVLELGARDGSEIRRRLERAAGAARLEGRIEAVSHDLRAPLPYPGGSFDAVVGHAIPGMALDDRELVALVAEARRVLRPGGLFVLAVRTDRDASCVAGIHHGGDRGEGGRFAERSYPSDAVRRLAAGWDLIAAREFEEAAPPRRLACVTLRRTEAA